MESMLVIGHMPILDAELTRSLSKSGFRLTETVDPDEALAICDQSTPDIAFIEVDAPDHDNLGVIAPLRAAVSRNGRIVAICNRYSDALDDHCEQLGANLALPQPDDPTNFKLLVLGLMSMIPASTAASAQASAVA